MGFLTWKGFVEMVLNGIVIGLFANIFCPLSHKFIVWLFGLFGK